MKEIGAQNLWNMNGGACEIPGDAPTLSQIPSLGRWVGSATRPITPTSAITAGNSASSP